MSALNLSSITRNLLSHFSNHIPYELPTGDTVYIKPLTLAEEQKIGSFNIDENVEHYADFCISQTYDVDGKKVFSLDDKQVLINRVPAGILKKIVFTSISGLSLDDAKKN